ncbi:MAG: D-tyrosyl-tRNA(Tyr) deacylase [Oscillospiraceae bacterium]|nr:D-tyrosyl-tRNA(Tyr) deacylase [Oscillospiraceae bacterium]
MRVVIQRVLNAQVGVDGAAVGSIGKGYLLLVGIAPTDTRAEAERIAKKISALRIFSDENDKINLSVKDVGGSILAVSQFTLYADCSHGNRPNFLGAAPPDMACEMYDYFCECLKGHGLVVEKGIFGADMKVSLLNDGPFTVLID